MSPTIKMALFFLFLGGMVTGSGIEHLKDGDAQLAFVFFAVAAYDVWLSFWLIDRS